MALALAGGLPAQRRRVLPARRRKRPLPRQLEPRAVEMAYARELRAFVAVAREAVKQHLLPALPSLLQQAAVERGDAAELELELHLDASAAQVRRLMGETRDALSRATNERQLQRLAEDMGNRTSTFQKAQLDKQVRAAVGVDVFVGEPHLGPLAEAFVETNVALIKSLPETAFSQVETLVHQAMRSGQRHEELAESIAERFDVAESRATLIARDQTLKYFGELNKARQQGLGVEAYVWRTSGDNRVRKEHEAREGKRFLWAEPPEDGHPGHAVLCFPGHVRVSLPTRVLKAYRRRYSGELTTLVTHAGVTVSATPNHPVLTQRGWLPVHLVNVGDYLFQAPAQGVQLGVADPERRDESLEELFSALSLFGVTHRVPGRAAWFHGDVSDEEVDVVDADWRLGDEVPAPLTKEVCEDVLALADQPALSPGPFRLLFDRSSAAASSGVRGFCKLATVLWRSSGHTDEHCRATAAWLDAATTKLRGDGRASHAEVLSKFFDAPSLLMQTREQLARKLLGVVRKVVAPSGDTSLPQEAAEVVPVDAELSRHVTKKGAALEESCRVVEKRLSDFPDGHVYNLETSVGWYGAEGIIVHNCRCSAEPDFESALEALEKEEVPPPAKPKRVRKPKPPPPPPEPVVLPPPPPPPPLPAAPPPPPPLEEPVRISGPHGAALARRQPMLNRVFGPKLEVMDEEAGKRLDAIALIPEKLLKALEPKMDFIRAGKGGVGSVDPNVAAMNMARPKDTSDKDQRTAEEVGGVFYEHTKKGKRLAPGSFAREPSQLVGRVVIGTVEGNAKKVVVHELGHAVDIMLTKSSLGETEFRKAWQEWRTDRSYAGWHKDYFTNDSYGHKEAFADIFDRYYVAGKADAVAVYGERLVKAVEADIARVLDADG